LPLLRPVTIDTKAHAGPIPGFLPFELSPQTGIMSVLDEFPNPHLLAGVQVLGQHLQQSGKVQIESLAIAHGWSLIRW
jgi:hypothetical protein